MKVKLIKEGLANMERLRKMVALAEEANAKINQANNEIYKQNAYIRGLTGVPNGMPQEQVDIAKG